jgi:hypothetical protein
MTQAKHQISVSYCTVESIMRRKLFRLGVDDVRHGRNPRFDEEAISVDEYWGYERGRMFGVLAPRSMPVTVEKKLNPEAVRFFKRHGEDIL